MQKIVMGLLVLLVSGVVFANPSKIISVAYDGQTHEFAVNTESQNGRPGFFRTKEIVLITDRKETCKKGCPASIKGDSYTSFSILVDEQEIAYVITGDYENLLAPEAFKIIAGSDEEQLVLDLNYLSQKTKAGVK